MVLLEDRQTGTFHLVPNRDAWTELRSPDDTLFRTEN